MEYKEFREKFECTFLADLQDEDWDGETIIRPNVEVAVPKEEEAIKKCFDIMKKQGVNLDEIYRVSEEVVLKFNNVKLRLISTRNEQ